MKPYIVSQFEELSPAALALLHRMLDQREQPVNIKRAIFRLSGERVHQQAITLYASRYAQRSNEHSQARTQADGFIRLAGKRGVTVSDLLRARLIERLLAAFDLRGRRAGALDGLEDFFRRITTGARNAGEVFKNVWREVSDYVGRLFGGSGNSKETSGVAGSLASLGGSLLGSLAGNSNQALSALGGLGSGALMGFSAAGPVGAVVGGLIGGIAGLFGASGGKEKRRDAEIANQGFAQLKQILEDYNHFRRDFASSVDSANRIWAQMQSQWSRAQSAQSQRPYFDAILRSMQSTEDERLRRRQMQALLPLPEFANGGLVRGSGSSGTLAVVHPGEFVMSRQAVDQLGVGALSSMNQSGGRAGAGLSISLEPASAQSLGEMLKRNPQALEEGLLVVLRRGGAVSRALRS